MTTTRGVVASAVELRTVVEHRRAGTACEQAIVNPPVEARRRAQPAGASPATPRGWSASLRRGSRIAAASEATGPSGATASNGLPILPPHPDLTGENQALPSSRDLARRGEEEQVAADLSRHSAMLFKAPAEMRRHFSAARVRAELDQWFRALAREARA